MSGTDLIVIIRKYPIGMVCGVVALAGVVALYLRSDVIDESKSKLDELNKQNQAMAANVRNSNGLAHQTAAIQQATKQLESRLVKANQLATNLQYFYRLESDTGIKLTDVRQNQVGRSSASLYLGVPYLVTLQGSYKQVLEFLQRIESGKHFSKFSSVSFNKPTNTENSGGLLSVSMTIELLGTP